MMETMRLTLLVAVLLAINGMVHSSQTVMKSMTKNFIKAYQVCAKEYNLPEGTITEIINFWKDDFTTTNRNIGCAIICLSSKLNLLDPEGKLHHGNAAEFAKQHGSDDETAKKLVEILHGCEKSVTPSEDHCMMALDVAMCFKKEIHNLNWAPDAELLFEELIAEVQ